MEYKKREDQRVIDSALVVITSLVGCFLIIVIAIVIENI
jgi:hypothetical protein